MGSGSVSWWRICTVVAAVAWLAALAASAAQARPVASAAQTLTQAAHSGSYYGATSTASAGGGAFEDVPLSTSAGQLICASAWVRTQYPSTAASGAFNIWLLGGAGSEGGSAAFSGLGNLGNWSQVHTCTEATTSHTTLRVQFYPTPGSPTVDMDDVDVHASLAVNGGFEEGGAGWSPYPGTNSNFSVYQGNSTYPAHSGSYFAATNTPSAGGGIYQDLSLATSAGETICGSAWVRTESTATGAAGAFVLWLIGGSGSSDAGDVTYSGLGNGTDWTQVQTCVEATSSHSTLRIQFYPNVGSPTVEIDDVDVHESLAVNGGFEQGGAGWSPYPGTGSNFSVYQGNATYPARSGSYFGATNTAAGGGGIYQDDALSTSPGELICGSAWLRTESTATGASGSFVLWLIGGGGAADSGDAVYSGLGNGTDWTQVQTCVEATSSHTTLRIQLYPNVGSPTVEIDDVDVHGSFSDNGGFEYGSGPWGTYPNTDSSYDAYQTGTVTAPSTPVMLTPVKTRLPLRIRVYLTWTWRYRVTRLDKAAIGHFPAHTRLTIRCLGRGCPKHRTVTATGSRRLHRLLRRLRGHLYREGQVLRVTLTAPGWRAERAEVVFRYGRSPRLRSLGR
jgi:hypothetical protein